MRLSSNEYKRLQANSGRIINSERQDLHQAIRWLKIAHPEVVYHFDFGADALLTGRQAKERKDLAWGRGWLDLMLFEPRGEYCGLALDLKREDVKIYKANGLFANEHFEAQQRVIELLTARGWVASFAKGFLCASSAIETYLSLPK